MLVLEFARNLNCLRIGTHPNGLNEWYGVPIEWYAEREFGPAHHVLRASRPRRKHIYSVYRMDREFFDEAAARGYVVMPRPRFVQEHKKLLQILERKDPKELEAERKEQAKELASYEGGSKASGYVRRLIAESKLVYSKVSNPSANLTKRYGVKKQDSGFNYRTKRESKAEEIARYSKGVEKVLDDFKPGGYYEDIWKKMNQKEKRQAFIELNIVLGYKATKDPRISPEVMRRLESFDVPAFAKRSFNNWLKDKKGPDDNLKGRAPQNTYERMLNQRG